MADDGILDDLLDLERRGWDSLCAGTGSDFYGRIMTEDAVMVLANGQVMDRDTVVAALASAPTWQRYEIRDPRVVGVGPDAAALVYQATAHRDAEQPPFTGLMCSVYVSSTHGRRLALYQQTPLAQPAS